MNVTERKENLRRGLKVKWPAGTTMGSYYDEEEIEVVVRTLRKSMNPEVGFGFICPEIEQFEATFARYCGTQYAVTINGAGTGLDMAMMGARSGTRRRG